MITLRHELKPGDLGHVVALHGSVYAREYGFDATFESYVAGPLADFAKAGRPRERLWLAEVDGRLVGCIAIIASAETVAQLRWYLVEPSARGQGLGKRLLDEAIVFSRQHGYQSIILWTVRALTAAARLYRQAGFNKIEEKPGMQWGVEVVEEKYELVLQHQPDA